MFAFNILIFLWNVSCEYFNGNIVLNISIQYLRVELKKKTIVLKSLLNFLHQLFHRNISNEILCNTE